MADAHPPVLVAMCGIPFAGKSTLAREIAARGGMTVVGVDVTVRQRGIDVGAEGTHGPGWARAIAQSFGQVRALLAAGESVVFDHANHTRRARDRCRRLADDAGARFAGVWVDLPVEVARQRQVANRSAPARPDVPDAAFRQIVAEFEPPTAEPDVIRWHPGTDGDTLLREVRRAAAIDS